MFSCFYKLISTPYQSDLHAYTILKTLRKSEFTKIKIHIKPEKEGEFIYIIYFSVITKKRRV